MTRVVVWSLGLVLASAIPGHSQSPPPVPQPPAAAIRHAEEGRPLVRVYQPLDIGGGSQTWAILQDRRGVLYIATNNAVLEYDGASWRRIPIGATGGSVRALALDDDGRIYLGTAGLVGYLAPDATGTMQFVSLIDHVPPGDRAFLDVWRVFVTSHGVFFQAERVMFRWADGKMTVIKPASRFNRASLVDDRVYLTTPEAGLNVLEGTTFNTLPGTDRLKSEPYPVVLRYDDNRLLVGTRQSGFFLYDGVRLEPFPTDFDALFNASQVYRGFVLADGTFAIATTSSGMAIFDRQGRRVMASSRASGLPSDTVYFLMPDREGALWLGHDRGLTRIETPSPLSYFDQSDGLASTTLAAERIDDRLYLALQSGLAYLTPAGHGNDSARFTEVRGSSGSQCWAIKKIEDAGRRRPAAIVAACGEGLVQVVDGARVSIKTPADLSFRVSALAVSKVDPTRLWAGLFDGLASFRWIDGRWIDEGRVEGITNQVRTLFENPDGSVWAGTQDTGVLRISLAASPSSSDADRPPARIERFGTEQGLPPGGVQVFGAGGSPFFVAGVDDPQVVRHEASSNRFVRDQALDGVVGSNPAIEHIRRRSTRRPGLSQLRARNGCPAQEDGWQLGRGSSNVRATGNHAVEWHIPRRRRRDVAATGRRPARPLRYIAPGGGAVEISGAHPQSDADSWVGALWWRRADSDRRQASRVIERPALRVLGLDLPG